MSATTKFEKLAKFLRITKILAKLLSCLGGEFD